jgi:hypothetical protein
VRTLARGMLRIDSYFVNPPFESAVFLPQSQVGFSNVRDFSVGARGDWFDSEAHRLSATLDGDNLARGPKIGSVPALRAKD